MAYSYSYFPYRRSYRRRGYFRRRRNYVPTVRTPTRRYPLRRRRQTVSKMKRSMDSGLSKPHPFLIANMNPFLPDAFNARVPDASTAPSSAVTLRDENQLTASAATNLVSAFFQPNFNAAYVVATQVSSSAVSWGASYAANGTSWTRLSSFTSTYNLARPVAHGVRLSCPLPPTSAAGYVHIALYSMSTYGQATWEIPTTVAMMRDLPSYKKLTLASLTQNPVVVVNKFLDQTAFHYVDSQCTEAQQSSYNQFQVPHGWMGILVMVDGHGVTTPCLDYEVILHVEGQARFGTLNGDASPEPEHEEIVQATAAASAEGTGIFREGTAEEENAGASFRQAAARSFSNRNRETMAQAGALIGDMAGRALGSMALGAIMNPGGIPGVNGDNRLAQR